MMALNIVALSMPGGGEMILILLVVLLLFGSSKLPELARGIGKAMREFEKAKHEFDQEVRNIAQVDEAPSKDRARLSYQSPNDTIAAVHEEIPEGTLLPDGSVKSPHTEFILPAGTKAPGETAFDAHCGAAFRVPKPASSPSVEPEAKSQGPEQV